MPCQSCGDCPEGNGTGEEECDLGHMHDCENCDGSGTLDMPDKTKCPECNGAGFTVVAQWKYQRVGNRWLNCFYLDMMARNLTNVRVSLAGGPERPTFFVADGGVEGALMPLREDRGYEADEYHDVPWR